MADNDPYGLFGDTTAAPRPKRQRTRTRAREVEQPAAETEVEDAEPADPYGLFGEDDKPATAPDADLKQGAPPGPAGKPELRPGNEREHAWYEPLLDSTASFAQGALQNWGDEALAGTVAATDYLGLTSSGNSFEENARILKEGADRVTHEYPYGHGAGQMAAGLVAGAMVPGAGAAGIASQGAVSGALSGLSEYGDTRALGPTALATGLGVAAGAGGAWVGNKAASLFATSPSKALERLGGVHEPVGPRPLPTPDAAPPPIPESGPPRPLSSPSGAPYDPLAAQTGAVAPEVPQSLGPPRPLPVERYPGGYDPLAAQQMATPVGTPRPMPVSESAPPSELESLLEESIAAKGGGGPRMLRGSNGKFQKVLPMGLDMSPAPKLPSAASEGPAYSGRWDIDLPPDAPLDFAPRPRVGGMPPEPGAPKPTPAEYLLGGVDAPADALPRPRVGAPPEPGAAPDPYALGELDTTPPPLPGSVPQASEKELQQVALRRAAQNMPPDRVGDGLRGLSNGAAMLGQGQAAMMLRGGALASKMLRPGARAGAIFHGDLVPNAEAGALARGGLEAAWELGAPAVQGGKVNAQDREETAYATAPVLNYALSATLHSGQTGLSQADEQRLTDAVVRGDDKQIAATDFRLRQKYPAYARAVERQLRDLNEERE